MVNQRSEETIVSKQSISLEEARERGLQAKLHEESQRPLIIEVIEVSKERTYKVIGTDGSEVEKNAILAYNWLVKGWKHVE